MSNDVQGVSDDRVAAADGSASTNHSGARRGPHRRERKRVLAGMGFVAPAAIVIFAFMLYPLIYAGYLSFTEYNFVYDDSPKFVGTQNYVQAFQDPQFITSLTNTGVYTVAYLS